MKLLRFFLVKNFKKYYDNIRNIFHSLLSNQKLPTLIFRLITKDLEIQEIFLSFIALQNITSKYIHSTIKVSHKIILN